MPVDLSQLSRRAEVVAFATVRTPQHAPLLDEALSRAIQSALRAGASEAEVVDSLERATRRGQDAARTREGCERVLRMLAADVGLKAELVFDWESRS